MPAFLKSVFKLEQFVHMFIRWIKLNIFKQPTIDKSTDINPVKSHLLPLPSIENNRESQLHPFLNSPANVTSPLNSE